MIEKIRNFVKIHFSDIMLFVIIVLLMLLAFASGFIVGKYQYKEPIKIWNTSQNT